MFLIFVTLFLSVFINSYADVLHISDSHGPISIMGEHMHKEGEIMFSYRFSNMRMHGLLNGEKKIALREAMNSPNSASDNSGTYMNSPVEMRMDMHMLGAMYAPNNNLTLMLMTNFVEKEMKQERPNMTSSTMLIDVQASATHLVLALKNLSSYYGNHIDETNNRVVPSNRKGMQQWILIDTLW